MNRYQAALARGFADRGDALFCRQVGEGAAREILWRDLEADCGRFAAAYRGAGLQPGDQALIFLRHVPDLYGAFFGAMLAATTPSYMPCSSPRQDPGLYWRSHQVLLAAIRPAAIVTDHATLAEMRRRRPQAGRDPAHSGRGDRAGAARDHRGRGKRHRSAAAQLRHHRAQEGRRAELCGDHRPGRELRPRPGPERRGRDRLLAAALSRHGADRLPDPAGVSPCADRPPRPLPLDRPAREPVRRDRSASAGP